MAEWVVCKWCGRRMQNTPKGQPRLCAWCRKRGRPPKKKDALDYRAPGSYETGKRR